MNNEFDDRDMIYPPTEEQVQDLKTHNVGLAIRLSAKLGRPLEDWEWQMFRKEPPQNRFILVE
ncbi:MAG: hypothetical protein LBN12_06410 [Clostridiales Family XIII bacterium]|jgi:hypothetical protein|nr:hypothetical protein [Clostridiales Family XIII bacterium]